MRRGGDDNGPDQKIGKADADLPSTSGTSSTAAASAFDRATLPASASLTCAAGGDKDEPPDDKQKARPIVSKPPKDQEAPPRSLTEKERAEMMNEAVQDIDKGWNQGYIHPKPENLCRHVIGDTYRIDGSPRYRIENFRRISWRSELENVRDPQVPDSEWESMSREMANALRRRANLRVRMDQGGWVLFAR